MVFGSRGSDRCRPDYDLDLLVIGKEERVVPGEQFHRWQDLQTSPRLENVRPASCIQEGVTLFTRPDLSTAQL